MSCKIRVKIDAKILAALGDSPEEKAAEILCSVFGENKKGDSGKKQIRRKINAETLVSEKTQEK